MNEEEYGPELVNQLEEVRPEDVPQFINLGTGMKFFRIAERISNTPFEQALKLELKDKIQANNVRKKVVYYFMQHFRGKEGYLKTWKLENVLYFVRVQKPSRGPLSLTSAIK